jgi:hypothetical protein
MAIGWGLLALGLFFSFLAGSALIEGRREDAWGNGGVAVVTFAVGTFLVWSGSRSAQGDRDVSVRGRLGEATVTGVSESSFQVSDEGEPIWVIRYTYRDHLGQEHEDESTVLQTQASGWQVGDKGKVRFDESNSDQSVWLGEREEAPRRADPPLPSLFKLAKRVPSLWLSPLLIVWGYVQFLATPDRWRNLERPYMFVVTGAILLPIAVRRVWLWWRTLRNCVPTDGAVTAITQTLIGAWGSRGRGSRDWAWIIGYSYRDNEGQPGAGESGYIPLSEGFGLKVGDQCRLRFDPQHPGKSVWIGRA